MKLCTSIEDLVKMTDDELLAEKKLRVHQMMTTSNIFEMEMYEDVLINTNRILQERKLL